MPRNRPPKPRSARPDSGARSRRPSRSGRSDGQSNHKGGPRSTDKSQEKAARPNRTAGKEPARERSGLSAPQALTGANAPISLLELSGWPDYALLDSGGGEKLEAYGDIRIVRPEPQALWQRRLAESDWLAADAVFTGNTEEEGPGRWQFNRELAPDWQMAFGAARFICRFTSFRHVGVFPEQAAHWAWMARRIEAMRAQGRQPKVLNLFGYTGVASLVAAAAGAEVTHVDASRKAISWARENQTLSGMDDLPIRWIVEDALKFTEREVRRGNLYDGVLLDPPKYGRGPKGEIWQLFDQLPTMLQTVEAVLRPDADFAVLTAYSIRASFLAMEELMRDVMAKRLAEGGAIDAGELVLRESERPDLPSRRLSTSLYCRYFAKGA